VAFKERTYLTFGPGISVSIATRYGLDGPAIESRCGFVFLHASVPFPGIKRPEPGVDHPPNLIAEVKERVWLYLYSLSGF
jgi:hypothetical protein